MPGQVAVKPTVEQVIQPQGIVRVRAGVIQRCGVANVELVKKPPEGDVLKAGELHAEQLPHQGFQAAIAQAPESRIALERHLRRRYCVIHWLLHYNAALIQKAVPLIGSLPIALTSSYF